MMKGVKAVSPSGSLGRGVLLYLALQANIVVAPTLLILGLGGGGDGKVFMIGYFVLGVLNIMTALPARWRWRSALRWVAVIGDAAVLGFIGWSVWNAAPAVMDQGEGLIVGFIASAPVASIASILLPLGPAVAESGARRRAWCAVAVGGAVLSGVLVLVAGTTLLWSLWCKTPGGTEIGLGKGAIQLVWKVGHSAGGSGPALPTFEIKRASDHAPKWIPTCIEMFSTGMAELPLWMIVVPLCALSLVAWRRARVRPGMCSRCGYDLRGIGSGVCPECGGGVRTEVAL